jgi:chromosome segregation ATPase
MAPCHHYHAGSRHKGRRSCAFGRVRADALEAAVIEGIFGEILTVANLEAQMKQMQEELDRDLPLAQAQVRLLEGKLRESEQAIGKLVEAVEAGAGSSALYTRLREREEERDHLREELDRAKQRNRPQRLQLDQVQELRRQLRKAFDSGPPQLARELLKTFLIDITVTKEALRVRYYPPFL